LFLEFVGGAYAIMEKIIPDTSVLIKGNLSELVETGKLKGEIIILEIVLSELENQANKKQKIGFKGLEELGKLKKFSDDKKITLTFHGNRPTPDEIKAAKFGAIDSAIRDAAVKLEAKLLTADYVMFLTAKARGIECEHIETEVAETLEIEKLFDKETMSIHLKLGTKPLAKKGMPGKVRLEKISDKETTEEELDRLIKEIIDYGRENKRIEISMRGATVVQMENIRISITEPPFSDATEITAVRPIIKVSLNDYKMSDKLRKRLEEKAEGVFICGPPGAGKSSFAAALAEFYQRRGAIVKTMENPRDLQVNKNITQYAPLEKSMEKTSDILLLVRPDYTIYDEVRKSVDFRIFGDMRLAGVGMVGVTHASEPIDAIQRMVSRLELGQIPHIVDTIIYIKDAKIRKIYETRMSVKVPGGMKDDDLARPVVEVLDFETGKVEYEIYTFGDQTVVMGTDNQPTEVEANMTEGRSEYIINFNSEAAGKEITCYAGRNFLFKVRLGKRGEVRIPKKNAVGGKIKRSQRYGDRIKGYLAENLE
jgi:ATPase